MNAEMQLKVGCSTESQWASKSTRWGFTLPREFIASMEKIFKICSLQTNRKMEMMVIDGKPNEKSARKKLGKMSIAF